MFKQIVLDTIDMVKAQVEVKTRTSFYRDVTFKVDGVLVYLDDSIVRARGSKVACFIRMPEYGDLIIVDDRFLLLSNESQRAVIHHERGHIVCGHLDMPAKELNRSHRKRMWKTLFTGKVCSNELEADAYAASVVGIDSMVEALRELYEVVGHNAEVLKRIDAVQSL
jgi:uncharacterized protein YunC (DUF1805 family)